MTQSLLNTPTPPFNGAANALYGDRGPQRGANTSRRRGAPPASLEEHIQDAIAKVPDLSPRQRNALRNTLMSMTTDISFIRLIHEQTRGPYSDQAAGVRQDEGRPL